MLLEFLGYSLSLILGEAWPPFRTFSFQHILELRSFWIWKKFTMLVLQMLSWVVYRVSLLCVSVRTFKPLYSITISHYRFFFPLVNFYQVCFFQVCEVFSGLWMPKSSVIQESQSCSASQVTTGLHHRDCLFITGLGHLIWMRFLPRVASAQNDNRICCLMGMFWDMLMNVL